MNSQADGMEIHGRYFTIPQAIAVREATTMFQFRTTSLPLSITFPFAEEERH